MRCRIWPFVAPLVMGLTGALRAATLTVGPAKQFPTLEAAYRAAQDGDTILVFPQEGDRPYEQVGVLVTKKRLTFQSAPAAAGQRVKLSGEGREYGSPRAILQFDPSADQCTVDGFEVFGARSSAGVAAGIRINQGNNITIRHCDIHHCDNGVMSNGKGTPTVSANQRLLNCVIHHNGCEQGPGAHNLYLAGTSVLISGCEIHSSASGHNVKCRAHHLRVEYSFIHDAANREFDLVDGKGDTDIPESDAVVIGNVIVKKAQGGNPHTFHFGQDGGNGRNGTLYLVNNTIVSTPWNPLIQLTTPGARAHLVNNIVWNGGAARPSRELLFLRGPTAASVTGSHNWFSGEWGESIKATGMDLKTTYLAPAGAAPPFVDAATRDFRLARPDPAITDAGRPFADLVFPTFFTAAGVDRPGVPLQYRRPHAIEPRFADGRPDLGAYERAPTVTTTRSTERSRV
jgi:hypothetical protein